MLLKCSCDATYLRIFDSGRLHGSEIQQNGDNDGDGRL